MQAAKYWRSNKLRYRLIGVRQPKPAAHVSRPAAKQPVPQPGNALHRAAVSAAR